VKLIPGSVRNWSIGSYRSVKRSTKNSSKRVASDVNSEENVTPAAVNIALTCPKEDGVTMVVKPRVNGKVFPAIAARFPVVRRLRRARELRGRESVGTDTGEGGGGPIVRLCPFPSFFSSGDVLTYNHRPCGVSETPFIPGNDSVSATLLCAVSISYNL
jgi:hypothetical protein